MRDTVLSPTPACRATSASVEAGLADSSGTVLRRGDRFFNLVLPQASEKSV
jgi:hypothetical protein